MVGVDGNDEGVLDSTVVVVVVVVGRLIYQSPGVVSVIYLYF